VAFLPQLALAPVLFFVGVTFLHEAAHAAMALAFGGRITLRPSALDLSQWAR
jgi:hypothetical protein